MDTLQNYKMVQPQWRIIKSIRELKAVNGNQAAVLKAVNDNVSALRKEFEAYKAAHP